MLGLFRAFAKSWVSAVLMGLLIVAFSVYGTRDLLRGKISNAVVQAGGRSVTKAEFQQIFDGQKHDYETRAQQAYPLEEAIKQGEDQRLVEELATETAYSEMLAGAGMLVGARQDKGTNAVLAAQLKKMAESGRAPALAQLFDAVTGKFDQVRFKQMLDGRHVTVEQFWRGMADDMNNQQFLTAVETGFRTPRIFVAVEGALVMQSRDVSYFEIPATSVPKPADPTDAQLNALIKQYSDRLMRPERRVLTVVRFSAAAIAPTITIDAATIQKEFDFRKDSYATPEKRSLIEIPLKDPKTAAAVLARLNAGEDPVAVAKSLGVDPVKYADQPQTAVADRKVAAVAFAPTLKAGQVSQPVVGDLGLTAIVKVTSVTPGVAADLNAKRTEIEADLRQKAAVDRVYDLTQKYDDAHQAGASIADAAQKVGASATSVGPVAADGKEDGSGVVNPLVNDKILKTAFGLAAGAESDVEQAGPGEYYVVRVDRILPPSVPALEEIRGPLTQVFMQQAINTALKAKADAAQAAFKAGQSFEAAAAGVGGHVTHQVGMQRLNMRQYQNLGQEFVSQVFSGKSGDVFIAGGQTGLIVGHIDAVHSADPAQVAHLIEGARDQETQSYLKELADAARAASRTVVRTRTDRALACEAMGVDVSVKPNLCTPAPAAAPAAHAGPAK